MTVDPARVGEQVTVHGTAADVRAGAAVVLPDGTPVYLIGLEQWDPAVEGRPVRVTGWLRLRAGKVPPPGPDGEVSHGLDASYGLDDPVWAPG